MINKYFVFIRRIVGKRQSKLLFSIQAWLLLQRNRKKSRRTVRFWKSGQRKNTLVSLAKATHKTLCTACFI